MADEHAPLRTEELDVWSLPAEEVDRMLATEDDPRLQAMFGADYEELRQLARQASRSVRGRGPLVLFLPGILGSTLGTPGNFFTQDTIWFDPVSIRRGDLQQLKLASSGRSRIQSLGVIPVVHSFLRLRLKLAGFDVEYYHYDWRQSLSDLGQDLATFIDNRSADKVMLVAHSMGGLVARAALKAGADKVQRVVMIGTPNQGSFASVEVLQGINGNVQLADRIDSRHTAAELTKDVFSTFPTIYELLPRPEVYERIDLFKAANWPKEPFQPTTRRLTVGTKTWDDLIDSDNRLRLIAGYGQETLTDLSSDDGNFNYHFTLNGDGTVPLNFCELDGVPTRYTQATHTGLLRSKNVADAVADLLRTGQTSELEATPAVRRSGTVRTLTKADFAAADPDALFGGRRGSALSDREAALLLEAMMSMSTLPPQQAMQQVAEPGPHVVSRPGMSKTERLTQGLNFNQTVITRDRQSHLDLELYQGSLFDAPLRAIVLGIFRNVDPEGPASILDRLTNGAVTELLQRRMLHGDIGQVFVMPTGRSGLKADYVLFVGLGDHGDFQTNAAAILQTVSCNVLRTLLHCGVDEFATVIYGGASGVPVRESVESLLKGYLDALQSVSLSDHSLMFRRVTFCETNPQKYAELKDELFRLGGSDLCEQVRLRLHEPRYPQTALVPVSDTSRQLAAAAESVSLCYLTVRVELDPDEVQDDVWVVHASLLTAGGKATVFPSAVQVDRAKLDKLIAEVPQASVDSLDEIGEALMSLLFTPEFRRILERGPLRDNHLVLIHDALTSRIPWEILPLQPTAADDESGDTNGRDDQPLSVYPALNQGLSRRYQTDGTNSITKFLEERQHGATLQVLSIVDPTEDLPGAAEEGKRVRATLSSLDGVTLHELKGAQATRQAVLQQLESGRYDVVHYAGHAFFDPEHRSRSGLLCSGHQVVSGRDLATVDKLPSLVFFNACESGRVRSRFPAGRNSQKQTAADRLEQSVGVAEALLRGGIAQFVGTYWPVGDLPAKTFAGEFYQALVSGSSVRRAVLQGRQAVLDAGSIDFADYLHYGSPGFVVKK